MQPIDPQRLQQVRNSKGLSRQALAREAKVSERQIARIESSSGGAKQVHGSTMNRLVDALGMSVAVLAGDEPLPGANAGGVPKDALVDPQRLRALRKGKRMSRKKLAGRSRVSERQIARIEFSATRVRATTLARLAKALDEDVETLVGDGPVSPEPPAVPPTQWGFRVSPQLNLAYDLVSHRYGPSRREIIELAPLLFTLLAEGSLAWRRQCLEQVGEAMDRLSDLGKKSQLYFANFPHYLLKEGCATEERSIAAIDLRGDTVRFEDSGVDFFSEDDLYAVTPFADYLCKLANDLEISGKVNFFPETTSDIAVGEFDMLWGTEPYQVCREELEQIAGGSESASSALAHGDVRLSDIPKELMPPDAKDKRVAWLEERGAEGTRQRLESKERMIKEIIDAFSTPTPTDTGTQEGDDRHD